MECESRTALSKRPSEAAIFFGTAMTEEGCLLRYPIAQSISLRSLLQAEPASYAQSVVLDYLELPERFIFHPFARQSLREQNAGGQSEISEALSIHYMATFHGATDLVYEQSVEYFVSYKMVDYVCRAAGARVGVSVCRAMGHPDPGRFMYRDAVQLLQKKVYGLIVARNAVGERHAFFRSVLHVFCQTERIARLMQAAFGDLDVEDWGLHVRGCLGLILTVCSRSEIYQNRSF